MKFSGKTHFFRSFPALDKAIEYALTAARRQSAQTGRAVDKSDIIRSALLASPILFPPADGQGEPAQPRGK